MDSAGVSVHAAQFFPAASKLIICYALRVQNILSQNIAISYLLLGVHELYPWIRYAGYGIQECFAQHDIWQGAFVHVEPDISHAEGIAIVY